MDEDVERTPESPADIDRRRSEVAELDRQHRKRRRELQQKAEGEPWDFIPETHDDLHNPADFEVPPLWEGLESSMRQVHWDIKHGGDVFDPVAATVGSTHLFPHYWGPGDNADLTRNLGGEDATRIYLYLDLTPLPEYRVADRLDLAKLRKELGVENKVSQSTLNRMPGRMKTRDREYYASETETLVRYVQDTKYEEWFRNPTPETIAPDGEGVPPVQTLARELRSKTFPFIRLKRDASSRVSKDAALRVLVTAANGNAFINDAAQNLDLKPWYDGDEVPTGQTLIYHIRKSSREQITRMFMEANEPLFEIADDHGYFDGPAEVAIDITDWPFFGDKDADSYVRGTKPGRNYARAWKYISLSLVGTDTPLTLLVLPVRKKTNAPYYVRRLLRLAERYIDIDRVYLDSGTEFYSEDTISTVNEFGAELVMQGSKSGSDVKRFLHGMAHLDMETNVMPYGVSGLDAERYTALAQKSYKKASRRKGKAKKPWDDYVYFYTNADMDEYSVEELAADYRNRWGIETGYRVLKEEFLAKSASPDAQIRTFYFNFAAHLYNLWTTANILRADDLGVDLSDGKQFTAGRFMQAIEDDPYDLDIGEEPPESRDVLDGLFL